MLFKTRYQAIKYKSDMALDDNWKVLKTIDGYVIQRGILRV